MRAALNRLAFSILIISVIGVGVQCQTGGGALRLVYNETTVSKDAQGRPAQQSNSIVVWISPEGDRRTETYDSNHHLISAVLFSEAEHRAIRLDYRNKSAVNIPAAERATESMAMGFQAKSTNQQFQFIGTRQILGLNCRGTRTTPQSGAAVEGWGCPDPISGQVVFGSMHIWAPNGMEMKQDLVRIERPAEIPPGLFDIPQGFISTSITNLSK